MFRRNYFRILTLKHLGARSNGGREGSEVLQYCNMSKELWSRVEISGLHCANIHIVVSGLSFNKTNLPHI